MILTYTTHDGTPTEIEALARQTTGEGRTYYLVPILFLNHTPVHAEFIPIPGLREQLQKKGSADSYEVASVEQWECYINATSTHKMVWISHEELTENALDIVKVIEAQIKKEIGL